MSENIYLLYNNYRTYTESTKGVIVYLFDRIDFSENECLEVRKRMYSMVQATRVYWIKIYKYLINIGFRQSKTDQCLFVKQKQKSSNSINIY